MRTDHCAADFIPRQNFLLIEIFLRAIDERNLTAHIISISSPCSDAPGEEHGEEFKISSNVEACFSYFTGGRIGDALQETSLCI